MCRFGQEGGAPIGRGSSADLPDAPDWEAANGFLIERLGRDAYDTLRFERRKLSMHDAKLIVEKFGKPCHGK